MYTNNNHEELGKIGAGFSQLITGAISAVGGSYAARAAAKAQAKAAASATSYIPLSPATNPFITAPAPIRITQQKWFWPSVIGGVVLLGGLFIWQRTRK